MEKTLIFDEKNIMKYKDTNLLYISNSFEQLELIVPQNEQKTESTKSSLLIIK